MSECPNTSIALEICTSQYKCCVSYKNVSNFYWWKKLKLRVKYIESTLFIGSQRPGSMVVVSLVQTLLEEIKCQLTHFQV